MKKVIILLALVVSAISANAQISTGESSSKVIRTGNRAQAGDIGLYIGATTDMFKSIGDSKVDLKALPLINMKFMSSDHFEWRVGLECWDKSTSTEAGSSESTQGESTFVLYPGFAYHYSPKNLLDVYMGAEVPFGFGSQSYKSGSSKESASYTRFGLGGFIGLQAYIGNLPVAVGCEYGLNLMNGSVSDGQISEDGYSISSISDKLDTSSFKLGHQVRLTLSYYFNF